MYTFKVSEDKEYKIKFGYKPTLKEKIVSKLVKIRQTSETESELENMEKLEEALLFLPELILVGLQTYHKDEFGYDYDSKDGKVEKLDKVMDLIEEYSAREDSDFGALLADLEEEMVTDSFLSSLFRNEMKKREEAEAKKTPAKKKATTKA